MSDQILTSTNYEDENFISMESDAEDPHTDNFPLLSYALRFQDFAFAERLLNLLSLNPSARSIVNAEDPLGETPLHLAAWLSNYEISRLLINLGADVNAFNHVGYSILPQLLFEVSETSLVEDSVETRIRDLLLENGAEYTSSGNTLNLEGLVLPDIRSEYYMNSAYFIEDLLSDGITLHSLYALGLVSGPVYKTLAFNSISGSDSGYSTEDEAL